MVIGTKMQKTAMCVVVERQLHKTGKIVKVRKKHMVHDPRQECLVGDVLLIKPGLKRSKNKSFEILEFVHRMPTWPAPRL